MLVRRFIPRSHIRLLEGHARHQNFRRFCHDSTRLTEAMSGFRMFYNDQTTVIPGIRRFFGTIIQLYRGSFSSLEGFTTILPGFQRVMPGSRRFYHDPTRLLEGHARHQKVLSRSHKAFRGACLALDGFITISQGLQRVIPGFRTFYHDHTRVMPSFGRFYHDPTRLSGVMSGFRRFYHDSTRLFTQKVHSFIYLSNINYPYLKCVLAM